MKTQRTGPHPRVAGSVGLGPRDPRTGLSSKHLGDADGVGPQATLGTTQWSRIWPCRIWQATQTNLGPQLETILSILWKATGAQKEVQRERNSFCLRVTGCPEVEKGQGRRFQAEDGKGDLWQMSINGL